MTHLSGSPSSNLHFTGRMLRLAWRYRGSCLAVILLNALMVAFNVAGLGLSGLGIDVIRHHVDPRSSPPRWPFGLAAPTAWSPMTTVTVIAAGVLGLALLGASIKYATALAGAVLSQRVLVQLRTDVYDKLQRLSFYFFDANRSSSLINRAAGDVQMVRTFVDGVVVKVLVVMLTLAVYLAYMLSVHVPLTLVCLLTSPLLWYGAVLFSRKVQPAYWQASAILDDLVCVLAENVQGMHVVKGFAREPEEIAKFGEANRNLHEQKRGIFWRISVYQPLMGLLTQLNMLLLIGYGGYLVVRGQLQLGAGLFVFANLLHEFANQVGQITNIASTIQSSLTGAGRVFEVLDAPIEVQSPVDAIRLPPCGRLTHPRDPSSTRVNCGDGKGAIGSNGRAATPPGSSRGRAVRFEHVTFSYRNGNGNGKAKGNGRPVLRNVSFEVHPGQCLGIVGETGAGKSTLLSLLARFYDVSAGGILVDGVDVRRLDLDDLRRNVGLVFQESFLFSNTVSANIGFGHPEATTSGIERAARLAVADEFIRQLPEGFETVVGEYGSNLSGGQRQRLAIARALLLDPPILLLDDATASVDPETEHEIRAALDSAVRGRTTLVVSNRISTLRGADRIIVLHMGRIIQQGTPAELLGCDGPYRRLAELQFADQQGSGRSLVAHGQCEA